MGLLLGLFWGCANDAPVIPAPSPVGPPPNILLITLCSWRVDMLGSYGATQSMTPHFDRFAADSIVFENAWSNATFTDAAHASLFTGLYPGHAGLLDFGSRIHPDVHTLPEILGLYGYKNQVFLDTQARMNIGGLEAMARGFAPPIQAPSAQLEGSIRDWMQAQQSPWLAWVHLRRAHIPYGEGEEFESHLMPEVAAWLKRQTTNRGRRSAKHKDPDQVFAESLSDPALKENLLWAYQYGLQEADAQLGEVLEGLQADGVLKDAIVMVVGDHGEALGEQGQLMHQGHLMPEVLHVPLAIHLPNRVPQRQQALVSLVDLLPTLSTLTATVPPAGVDGHDLMPVIRGEAYAAPPVLAQAMRLLGADHRMTLQTTLIAPPYWYNFDVEGQALLQYQGQNWVPVVDEVQAQQMQAQADILGKNSVWQSIRPALPAAVQEELRKNGYW